MIDNYSSERTNNIRDQQSSRSSIHHFMRPPLSRLGACL
ncbi:hypothetical protein DKAM_0037 [Desulfurococcus amylolyticus 1221n]|uniref:Uncharacterized protein n=1 Tax=Desulfurococcus amylolyticus (strain DSM 18924 / JCM 16383 / VKM B-2413 / 1221n) TaxID=490899 RepID=B8D395_DESA1|nr:hypothetical protein DKAM_0037 [Desulfurococcus amylolyticus 1221n]